MRDVLIGQVDYTVLVKIVGTDGAPETGLTEASIDLAYSRVETDNDVTVADVTPAALAALTDAHTDWGFEEVDATNAPGLYRLDIADAVFASGAWEAVVTITDASGTDFYAVDIGFRLVNIDPQASVVPANVTQLGGDAQSATDLKDFADAGYDPSTNKVQGVVLTDTVTTLTNLPAITANWLTAAGIAAGALNGKGDWNIGKTGYALSAAGIQAIWDALTSALTTVGSIGKLLVDNINATISSRSSHTAANVRTEMDSNSTQLAAIVADTNELQTDWANGGRLDLLLDATLADTNELQTDWADGGRLDVILDARASQTSVDDLPTNAEFEARTLVAASYFDPATDTVANVTTVGSVTGAVGSVAGHTAQTGDSYAIVSSGTHGNAALKTLIDTVDTVVDGIAADLPNKPVKGVELQNLPLFMVDDTDLKTPETGLTLTTTISKDGGAFASTTNSATEISGGYYKLTLTSTEMNANVVIVKATGTGAAQRNIAIFTQPT